MRRAFKFFSTFVLVLGLVAGVGIVRNVVNFRGKASGVPANLVVDLHSSFSDTKNSWQFFAQGGEEQGRSLAPVVAQTKALKPQYIRIDHVYDFFHVVTISEGKLVYNWSELDGYIKDIQETGAKPFLALSYTPTQLGAKDIDMPDQAKWTELVRNTIEHISGKGGLAISDVYYEVWNEPDLFGSFKVYPPKDYRSLYRASSFGANSAKNTLPFKLGGPATTGLYKNWFDALVNLKAEENVRVDFLSWHNYGEDTGILSQDIANAILWRGQSGNQNIELFVTENGVDSANNPDYDGTRSAFHSLSAAAASVDRLDGLFSFEIKDGPGPSKLWGRWGLLTHEKFGDIQAKPRYKAFEFLNAMSTGERVNIAGNGSWVTSFGRSDSSGVRLFVVNYDSEGKHLEAVPIRFVGIPFQKFLFRKRDFLGSATQVSVTPVNGEWQTVQLFKPNSASIMELIPQK